MSDAAAAAPPKKSKLAPDLIVALVNTLAVVAVAGLMVYTQILFKRPPITEETERARLEKIKAKPKPPPIPGQVQFDPLFMNIVPTENLVNPDYPKTHHLAVAFALEIRDGSQAGLIEELKPMLLDQVIKLVGKKRISDLNQVQGRYLLRSQIMEVCNHIIAKYAPNKESLVSNVFFTQYTVQ